MSADQFRRQVNPFKPSERLAGDRSAVGETPLGRRVRELKANLVRDIMRAVSMASAAELGELFPATLERHTPAAVQLRSETRQRPERERPAAKARGVGGAQSAGAANERDASLPPPPNDPFDITSPMELLASTDESSVRPAAVHEPPARMPSILEHPRPAESVTSLTDGDKEAASERRPTVVLREGEHLLSATGSGVVIRRERRVSPPR